MPSLFRRKSDDLFAIDEEAAAAAAGEPVVESRPKGYTPSKRELGRVTPRRRAGGRVVEPPPANRREALRRARQKQREARAEARAGMMAGKEEYLLPRDRGPERALVRDIVDSRRNVASYFLPVALIVVIGASGAMPPVIQLAANLLWFLIAAGVIIDSIVLARRIRRSMLQQFPKTALRPRSLYFYGILRSLSFRKLRMPGPRVNLGDKV